MLLYLIRHAHAIDAKDDAARPLSKRGRDQVRALGEFLQASGVFAPEEIWHSPLIRAHETAWRLAKSLGLRATLVETATVRPEDPPASIAQKLSASRESLAIVGHEPHLSSLASLLVTGRAEVPVF